MAQSGPANETRGDRCPRKCFGTVVPVGWISTRSGLSGLANWKMRRGKQFGMPGKGLVYKRGHPGGQNGNPGLVEMKKSRLIFYAIVGFIYPFFFLLHWNGMLGVTYYWALVLVNGTHSFLPELVFSLISSVIIFGIIVLMFEMMLRTIVRAKSLRG